MISFLKFISCCHHLRVPHQPEFAVILVKILSECVVHHHYHELFMLYEKFQTTIFKKSFLFAVPISTNCLQKTVIMDWYFIQKIILEIVIMTSQILKRNGKFKISHVVVVNRYYFQHIKSKMVAMNKRRAKNRNQF